MSSNDSGRRVLELNEEERILLLRSCEANITLGMNYLQMVHDGKAELNEKGGKTIVEMIENFRKIRTKLEEAA